MFLTQPGPGQTLSPAGTPLQLNCSAVEGYVIRSWHLELPEGFVVTTSEGGCSRSTDGTRNHSSEFRDSNV